MKIYINFKKTKLNRIRDFQTGSCIQKKKKRKTASLEKLKKRREKKTASVKKKMHAVSTWDQYEFFSLRSTFGWK